MNLGALLRSAHFLGVDGVMVSEKNSAPLTPVVSKASSGAANPNPNPNPKPNPNPNPNPNPTVL